jgi:hypothetical protein
MQRNSTRPRVLVTGDGKNVVGDAGCRLLCDLADELGLTDGLSMAMAPTKQRCRGHDRGRVLVDLAVMLADGGEFPTRLTKRSPATWLPVRDLNACSRCGSHERWTAKSFHCCNGSTVTQPSVAVGCQEDVPLSDLQRGAVRPIAR